MKKRKKRRRGRRGRRGQGGAEKEGKGRSKRGWGG